MCKSERAFLFCFAVILSSVFWGCRYQEKPAAHQEIHEQSPTSYPISSLDSTGIRLMQDTIDNLLDSGEISSAAYFMGQVISRFSAGRQDTLIYPFLRDNVINAVPTKNPELVLPVLDTACILLSGSPEEKGLVLNLKGYLLQELSRYPESNEAYWVAMSLLPEERCADRWALMFNNITQNYNSFGDYKSGARIADRNLAFVRVHHDSISPADSLELSFDAMRNLGWALYEQKQTDAALAVFNKALEIAPDNNKPDILTFISKCYLEDGKLDKAFAEVKKALRFKEIRPDRYIDAVHQLARCHLYAGNLEIALQQFHAEIPLALKEYKQQGNDFVKIFKYIGEIHEKMHRPDSALHAYQLLLHNFFADSLMNNPGPDQLHADYNLFEALSGKSRSLQDIYERDHSIKDLQQALECTRLAVSVKNKLTGLFQTDTSQLDFASGIRPLYESGIRQALLLRDTTAAYRFVQEAKAAVLRGKMARDNAFMVLPDSLKEAWDSLTIQRNSLEKSGDPNVKGVLLGTEARLRILESRIRQLSPNFAALETISTPLEPRAIRQNLPENAAILDFFSGDSIVFLFVIHKKGILVYQMPAIAGYLNDINTLRGFSKETTGSEQFLAAARNIYRYLMEAPLADLASRNGNISRLWIVPDNLLHTIPFDALLTADVPAYHSNLPFLVRKYASGIAFTVQQFFPSDEHGKMPEGYAGWGIQYDEIPAVAKPGDTKRNRLAKIPKAVQEVEAVHRIFGGTAKFDYTAQKADFIKNAAHAGLCHLAMHAVEAENSGLNLVFVAKDSAGMPVYEYLSAAEISALPLRARLVVLSACQTAKGELMPGEGIESLGRAFQFAGAQSVLMTHWDANDNAAYKLIPSFFEGIKSEKGKDEALREAKMTLLDNPSFAHFHSPKLWAGFVIYGDLRPIKTGNQGLWLIAGISILCILLSALLLRRIRKRY